MRLRLAIDAMGGDGGPAVTVPAALTVLAECPDLELELWGQAAQMAQQLPPAQAGLHDRLFLMAAEETVGMDESPLQALRGKPRSSMRLSLDRLAGGHVQACVSAGNSGALVLIGHHVLKPMAGIERAAMCTAVPTVHGHSYLLDVGAGLAADAEQLVQYALMGAAMARTVDGTVKPSVALLNVGEEAIKGTLAVRAADRRLRALSGSLRYTGFVEGDDLFAGAVDVIVCDGFAGNIALKASEGVARLVADKLSSRLQGRWWLRFLAGLMAADLRMLRAELDPEHFNGACLLGLRGAVVKSHGAASVAGFAQALRLAANLARRQLVANLERELHAATSVAMLH